MPRKPSPKQRECMHENFSARVDVNRIEDTSPMHYTTAITVWCEDCGLPFRFRHLPHAIGTDTVGCSVDGREAWLPIEPEYEKMLISGTCRVNINPDVIGGSDV